jgi:hypothetical protein
MAYRVMASAGNVAFIVFEVATRPLEAGSVDLDLVGPQQLQMTSRMAPASATA